MFFSKRSLIIGTEYLPVAYGSPGPFERNIPSGFKFNIFSEIVSQGTIVILLNLEAKHLRILFFTP